MKSMQALNFWKNAAVAAVFSLTTALAIEAVAQPAPAGALIENQARISFFNERLGIYESIPTNIVSTRVRPVPAIDVIEDQITYLTPDTLGQLAYFVRNTGNTQIATTISLSQQSGDDFDLLDVALYADLNGNGIVDPADQPIPTGSSYPIPVGEELGILVQFRTPAGVQDSDSAGFTLVADDQGSAVSGSATGTLLISTTGLAVEKEVNLAQARPGDTLRYTLELRNRGSNDIPGYNTIDGVPIRIDGQPVSPGILLRDSVPLNTTFAEFVGNTSVQGFEAVFRVAGVSTSAHDYFTVLPAGATLADVDVVAFFRAGDYPASFSTDFSFELTVSENIGNTFIPNTAETWQYTGPDVRKLTSNPVRTRVDGVPGRLDYTDPQGNVIFTTGFDTEVRLRLSAAACNRDASTLDGSDLNAPIIVNIATSPEGDFERILVRETGPNTGIFESWAIQTTSGLQQTPTIPVQNQIPVIRENGIISGDRATEALASIVCGGETITARLVINPGGYVFNSASNRPVPGAEVVLYDASGNQLQSVFSDATGFYVFDETLTGAYEIEVFAPAESDVVFPSQRFLFPGWDRNINEKASYGRPFTVPGDLPSPFFGIDIPLDPDTRNSLVLLKEVEPDVASPGDIVAYRLTLENRLDIAIANTTIYDQMPSGLTFVEGSALIDGQPINVTTGPNGELVFDIGDLLRRQEVEITYAATVDPLADGRLVNTAYADGQYYGDGRVRSNDARATLRVSRDRGVFTDRGVILGTVYVDFNRNGIRDRYVGGDGTQQMEPGIPGVRIYFENGAHVVTDIEGRYSMPGMSPRLHVAAVSVETLPEIVELVSTTTRDAMSPQSRFIRLRPGEVAGEYFAVIPREGVSNADVLTELARRNEIMLERGATVGSRLPEVEGNGAPQSTDFDNYNATSTEAAASTRTGILSRSGEAQNVYSLPAEAEATPMVALPRTRNLESLIGSLSPALAFLELSGNDTVNDDIVTIRVKGPSGGRLGLRVNGEAVSNDRISQRVSAGGVEAIEYVAIRLRPGANELQLTFADPFGNIRQTREITVNAPGSSANVVLITPPTAYADPASPIPVLVRITDAEGLPTGVSMDLTLESSDGSNWGARDIRPSEPGLQVFIDNGEALIDYYPPDLPGTHTIQVRNGLGRFSTNIVLEPSAGDRVIVGYIEGVVGVNEDNIDTSNLVGYDETITGINGSLYLRGRIRGDAILTLRYDSDKDSTERLFRDVDPQTYYPVYGDASERGFDAQSRSQLYIRIDHGRNYVLYGDISMEARSDAIQLGAYSRSLTGLHAHYEDGPVRIDLMAGRTDQSQVIREFRAEGVSGPYDLDLDSYLEGSEVVEIVTRDRRQSSSIISTVRLQRYVDYRLDFFNDSIIFDVPVPATDDDGNPNFIRVTYETESGSEDYWVYSGEVSYDVNDRLTVGYREIRADADDAYEDRRTVRTGYVTAQLGERSNVELEFAQSINNLDDEGTASRLAYNYRTNNLNLTFEMARTDEDFLDAGSSLAAGREELTLEAEWTIQPGLLGKAGVVYDHDLITGDERYGAEALLSYGLNNEVTIDGGLRFLDRRPGNGDPDQTVPSLVFGGRYAPESRPGFSIGGELELDMSDTSNFRMSIDTSDQVTERLRVFSELGYGSAGSEFLDFSAASGDITTFKAGFEYRFTDQILAFSNLQSGAQTGISVGISSEWAMDETGWGRWFPGYENAILYGRIERFEPYDVDDLLGMPFGNAPVNDDAQTTFALGSFGEYNDGNGAVRLDTEGTIYNDGYSLYARQYWAQGYNEWTWALENRFAYSDRDSEGTRVRNHFRVGAAYRDQGERLDLLSYAGVRLDDDPQANLEGITAYWLASGSLAYNADSRFTFRQAGQYSEQTISGFKADSFLTLGQIGFDHDFTIGEKFDARIGGHVGGFYDVLNGGLTGTYGIEFGYVPTKNVMISAGYNHSDVQAAQISEIYNTGAFLRFSIKLDNGLWDLFDRAGVTTSVGGN